MEEFEELKNEDQKDMDKTEIAASAKRMVEISERLIAIQANTAETKAM